MDTDIEIQELMLDDKQTKQFAYAIFNDINDYIKQNEKQFFSWLIGIEVHVLNNIIVTLDEEMILRNNYNYNLCRF